MIATELLEILCCPETHQPLRVADEKVVAELNRKIAAGQLQNRAGKRVEEKIEGALVRQDGKYLYVIRNNIPVMLIDEAVAAEGR